MLVLRDALKNEKRKKIKHLGLVSLQGPKKFQLLDAGWIRPKADFPHETQRLKKKNKQKFPLWLRGIEPDSHPGGRKFDPWPFSVG